MIVVLTKDHSLTNSFLFATMGAAVSTLAADVSANMNASEKSVCSVENVCQGVEVDDVSLKGVTINCGTINIGTNSSKSSFTCSLNQSAISTANVVQKEMASATAAWGDISDSNLSQNIGVSISNKMQEQCGGATQSVGNTPSSGITPNGGACSSGIVQNSTIKTIGMEDSKIDCNVLDIGVNNANTSVQCTLHQLSKADTQIQQSGKAIAKDVNLIMEILIAVFAVALFIIIAPFIVGGIIKAVDNIREAAEDQKHADNIHDQLKESEQELRLEMLQGEAFEKRRQLEAEGMRADQIGLRHRRTPNMPPPQQGMQTQRSLPSSARRQSVPSFTGRQDLRE